MKITLDKNTWTTIVSDFDLNSATKHDMDLIGCLVAYNTIVVVKNQKLTVEKEEEIAKMLGHTFDDVFGSKYQVMREHPDHPFFVDGSILVHRVTAEKNSHGFPGVFPDDDELVWHCNRIEQNPRRDVVWLYGVKGTEGSETWFTNHVLAYNDLDEETKNQIAGLTVNYEKQQRDPKLLGYLRNAGYKGPTFNLYANDKHNNAYAVPTQYSPPLVFTNKVGQTGLHLSWLPVESFSGMSVDDSLALRDKLRDHILGNEQYLYKHQWENGDVLIADQWFGVHKRPPFAKMDQRLLHRIEVGYERVDFSCLDEALAHISK